MARPKKVGLDYFPMDLTSDDSLELLEAECGLEGFAILVKIWQKIYSNGYYIEWSEDVETLFSRKINSEKTKVNSVITTCFKRNLLDKHIYETYGILTSKGIQKRYLKACTDSKRSYVPFIKELILVNSEFTKVISEFTSINPEETQGFYGSLDTKEKEKEKEKGKEIEREKESKSAREDSVHEENPKPPNLPTEFSMSDAEHVSLPECIDRVVWQKWVQYLGKKGVKTLIDDTINQQHHQLIIWNKEGISPEDVVDNAIAKGIKSLVKPYQTGGERKSQHPPLFGEDGFTDAMRRFAND